MLFLTYIIFLCSLENMSCWVDSNLETSLLAFLEWMPTFKDNYLTDNLSCITTMNYDYNFVGDMLSNLVQSVEVVRGRAWE